LRPHPNGDTNSCGCAAKARMWIAGHQRPAGRPDRTGLMVMRGQGRNHIADELLLSLATVKTHLHHAFDKTDTHRQAELVRLLLSRIRYACDIPRQTVPGDEANDHSPVRCGKAARQAPHARTLPRVRPAYRAFHADHRRTDAARSIRRHRAIALRRRSALAT
jgi:hypothetical protein